MTDGEEVLDSIFHGCALKAYLEVWVRTRQFPPDSEATRIRAYQLYEEALAEKNRRNQPLNISRSHPREAGPGCGAPDGSGNPHRSPTKKGAQRQKPNCRNRLDAARKAAK